MERRELTMEMEIKNPKNCNWIDVKKEITQTADCITTVLTYPNGFVMTTVQHAGEIKIDTNRPLINNGDGTFSIPE